MTQTYPGFNVLLMGETGTGKTYSIKSLADTGLEVFYFALEPGLETLIGAYIDKGEKLPSNLHWHYLQPKTQGFSQLQQIADQIGKFDLAGLTKIKDINRSKNNQMYEVFGLMNDFIDQKDGSKHGCVDTWGTDRVVVLDGLSALSRIAMEMVIGTKPVRDKPDYGIAQNNLMGLIHKLTSGCNCHFVLIAHVNREVDEIMGGAKLFPNTIGKAILSDIQQPFSDTILTIREVDKFYWDTANSQASLKTRNLPIRSKLDPDFGAIYSKWKARADAAAAETK